MALGQIRDVRWRGLGHDGHSLMLPVQIAFCTIGIPVTLCFSCD